MGNTYRGVFVDVLMVEVVVLRSSIAFVDSLHVTDLIVELDNLSLVKICTI